MSGPHETLAERRARFSRNEALFRIVNERMNDLNEAFAELTNGRFEIVCECGELMCVRQIAIDASQYERVRIDPTLFIVFPGHEDASVEGVVEDDRSAAYLVVRKHQLDSDAVQP